MAKTLKAGVEITGKNSSGSAFKELIDAVDKSEKKFKGFQDRIAPIGRGFGTVATMGATAIGAVAGAVTGLVGGAISLSKAAQEEIDAISDLSANTGLAVNTIAQMAYVSKLSGVEAGAAEAGYKKFALTMTDIHTRGSSVRKALMALNPEFARNLAATKSTDAAYRLTLETLARMTDGDKRLAIAKKLFGKAALGVNAIVSQGADKLHELMAEGDKYNEVTDEMTEKAGAFGDAQDKFSFALQSLKRVVGVELMPVLTDGATALADFIAENKGEIRSGVATLASNLGEGIKNIITWVKDNPGAITKFFGDAADAANTLIATIKNVRTTFDDLRRLTTGDKSRQDEALERADSKIVYGIPTNGEIESGEISTVRAFGRGIKHTWDQAGVEKYSPLGAASTIAQSIAAGFENAKVASEVKVELKVPKNMAPMTNIKAPGVSVQVVETGDDIAGHTWG